MIEIKRTNRYTFAIDGQTIEATRIGRGRFCTAYRATQDPARVLLVVSDTDFAKDILADADGPTIPRCVLLGQTATGRVFETDYSETVSAKRNADAWRIMKTLEATRDRVWREHMIARVDYSLGYSIAFETIERADVPATIKDDLNVLLSSAANYGSSYSFEFAKRNTGVTTSGLIQFRDCVFDLETLAPRRRAKNFRN